MLELPHPELEELTRRARDNVRERRQCRIAGTDLSYGVVPASLDMPEPALYDEFGNVYVSEELLRGYPQYADLVAFHELREIEEKLAGLEHGEAHRRAYVAELLAAKGLLPPLELTSYLRWRVAMYPDWKGLDVDTVTDALATILGSDPCDDATLYQVVRDAQL